MSAGARLRQAAPRKSHRRNALALMRTRSDLYQYLGCHSDEEKLDALIAKEKSA